MPNRLNPLLVAGDTGRLDATIRFLNGYARNHFGMEEKLMARHAYPFLAEHAREHRNLAGFLARLRSEVQSGHHSKQFLAFQVQVFLLDWFASHSTGTDRHLARFLRGLNVTV